MLIERQPPLHLTYCLNVHRGESWAENFAAVREHTLAVRERVAPGEASDSGCALAIGPRWNWLRQRLARR